jgi:hypothetical protein
MDDERTNAKTAVLGIANTTDRSTDAETAAPGTARTDTDWTAKNAKYAPPKLLRQGRSERSGQGAVGPGRTCQINTKTGALSY